MGVIVILGPLDPDMVPLVTFWSNVLLKPPPGSNCHIYCIGPFWASEDPDRVIGVPWHTVVGGTGLVTVSLAKRFIWCVAEKVSVD